MNEKAKIILGFTSAVGILGLTLISCHLIKDAKEKIDKEEKLVTVPSGYTLQNENGKVVGVKNTIDENGKVKKYYTQAYDYETNTFVSEEFVSEENSKGR